jgi:hypothetical protein
VRNGCVVPPLRRFQLNGVCRPVAAVVPLHDKVECEPTEGTLLGQPFTDPDCRLTDQSRVGRVGREDAAEIALPARAAEKLIMSGQQR